MTAPTTTRDLYPLGYKLCTSPLHRGTRWIPVMHFGRKAGSDVALLSHCRTCRRLHERTATPERRRRKRDYALQTSPVYSAQAHAAREDDPCVSITQPTSPALTLPVERPQAPAAPPQAASPAWPSTASA